MSGGYTKPKAPNLIPKAIVADEDEDKGASEQLLALCEYMMKEHLNQEPSEISKAFATYAGKERDLYDMIVWTINSEPAIAERMKNKRKFKEMGNLFNGCAGTTIDQRMYNPLAGVKVFKAVGQVYEDGTCRDYASLTAAPKSEPASPKRMFVIPSGAAIKEGKGIVSPTSPPHGQIQWPVRQTSRGKSETRGGKIPNDTKAVRLANASVRPPSLHQHDIRDFPVLRHTWASSSHQSLPAAADPIPKVVAVIGMEAPEIILEPSHMSVSSTGQTADGPVVWPQSRVDAASKVVISYLRHGTEDPKYNLQGTDGYISVGLLVQLPLMKANSINKQVIELILRCTNTRLATDATRTRVRAIQGHSLLRYHIDELYKEIKTLAAFRADPVWTGDTSDHLVIEISKELTLIQWARAKILPPTTALRWHTMKAVSGTGRQNYGSKSIILYVFLNVEEVYADRPKIALCKTDCGRIVIGSYVFLLL